MAVFVVEGIILPTTLPKCEKAMDTKKKRRHALSLCFYIVLRKRVRLSQRDMSSR